MIRMIRGLTFLCIGLFCLCANAGIFSDQSKQTNKPLQTVKPIPVNLKVQNFALPNSTQLKVQFRYINDKLKFIAFRNIGKVPLEVKIFANSYVLADGNELSIQAPNVERIVIEVGPYVEAVGTVVESSLPGSMYLFSIQPSGFYALNSTY